MDKKQKLIDVDEFIRTIHYHDERQKTDVWLTEDIEYLLVELPAVDAKPVVRGRWTSLTDCANAGVYCSVCLKKVYKEDYAWCNRKNKLRSNFCPNCGADMRGNQDGN